MSTNIDKITCLDKEIDIFKICGQFKIKILNGNYIMKLDSDVLSSFFTLNHIERSLI